MRKGVYTRPDLGGVLHALGGREGSVKSLAKPLQVQQRVLNVIPSYIFKWEPAAEQGKHTDVKRLLLGCTHGFGLFWQ